MQINLVKVFVNVVFCRITLLIKIIYTELQASFKKIISFFIRVTKFRVRIVRIKSVKSWCQQNNAAIVILNEGEEIHIRQVKFFEENNNFSLDYGQTKLPPVYLANISNVNVVGGGDLILHNNDALYDELALVEEGRYGAKVPFLKQRWKDRAVASYFKGKKIESKQAIHFCKDHSYNYFHWLVECLPRLSIVNQFPEFDSLPLLIDLYLYPQQIQALNILNTHKREYIILRPGRSYRVENLIYPSNLSVIHDNYDSPVSYQEDIVISPTAIQYLRDNFKPLFVSSNKADRKIFISRKKMYAINSSSPRALVNSDEIERIFIENGFEIVFPDLLSFANQVEIFSQAKVVAGPPGAGMANMIFMPPGGKVIMLYYHNPQVNFYLFDQLANILSLDLQYVLGEETVFHPQRIHSSFKVEKEKVKRAIHEILYA